VADGVLETKLPAAHELHVEQEAALAVLLQAPLAQAAQLRSAIALPAPLTDSPTTQLRQALQLAAFAVALKVPLAQALQARSAVAEPALLTS
jgi:hypothetical protein